MTLLLSLIAGMLAEAMFRLEFRHNSSGWGVHTLTWRDATRRLIGRS